MRIAVTPHSRRRHWAWAPRSRRPRRVVVLHARRYRRTRVGRGRRDLADRGGASFCMRAALGAHALGVGPAIPPTAAECRSACGPLSAYPRWAWVPRSRRPRRSVVLHAGRSRRASVGRAWRLRSHRVRRSACVGSRPCCCACTPRLRVVPGVSFEALGLGAVEAGESGVLRVSVAGWRSGGLSGAASARLSGRGVYIPLCGIGPRMAVPEHPAFVQTTVGIVCTRLSGPTS